MDHQNKYKYIDLMEIPMQNIITTHSEHFDQ